MRPDSLAFRLGAAAAIWSLLVLASGGLLLSSIFRQSVERSFDSRLEILLGSLIASADLDPEGHIYLTRNLSESRFQLAYSGWYWQVGKAGTTERLRSRSLWDQSLPLPSQADAVEQTEGPLAAYVDGPEGHRLRVLERQVMLPGSEAAFSFAVSGDTEEIEAEVANFNGMIFTALAVLGGGLLIGLLIQVRFGLRPLEQVRRTLSRIRSGDADRLEGDFPAEIEPLVGELNSLLAYNQEVLERARTHVGNLAHALKTPLSVLANEAQANPGERSDMVARQTQAMREQIDRHLARARTAASANALGARAPVGETIGRLARTLARIYQERNITIDVSVPEHLTFRGEAQDLEEMVGNLLDNACKWAGSQVKISAEPAPDFRPGVAALRVRVSDDGPGLPEDQRNKAMKRGERLDETVPGSGLGLSIVSEIAELYGGSLSLCEGELGGLAAILYLPAATPLSKTPVDAPAGSAENQVET